METITGVVDVTLPCLTLLSLPHFLTGSSSLSYNTPSHADPSPRLAAKEGRSRLMILCVCIFGMMQPFFISMEQMTLKDCWKVKRFIMGDPNRHADTHIHTHTLENTDHSHRLPLTKLCAGAPFVSFKIIAKLLQRIALFRAATWTLGQHRKTKAACWWVLSSSSSRGENRREARRETCEWWWMVAGGTGIVDRCWSNNVDGKHGRRACVCVGLDSVYKWIHGREDEKVRSPCCIDLWK